MDESSTFAFRLVVEVCIHVVIYFVTVHFNDRVLMSPIILQRVKFYVHVNAPPPSLSSEFAVRSRVAWIRTAELKTIDAAAAAKSKAQLQSLHVDGKMKMVENHWTKERLLTLLTSNYRVAPMSAIVPDISLEIVAGPATGDVSTLQAPNVADAYCLVLTVPCSPNGVLCGPSEYDSASHVLIVDACSSVTVVKPKAAEPETLASPQQQSQSASTAAPPSDDDGNAFEDDIVLYAPGGALLPIATETSGELHEKLLQVD
jgi:hypothetical protein